jgi:hypothetical protein
MNEEKRPAEAIKIQNPGKKFWSALDYIISSFREYGTRSGETGFGIEGKSITLSTEEWNTLNKQFDYMQKAILDTWEDAEQLANDLTEMRSFHPDDAEAYRKAGREKAESILERLKDFVDDDQVEV